VSTVKRISIGWIVRSLTSRFTVWHRRYRARSLPLAKLGWIDLWQNAVAPAYVSKWFGLMLNVHWHTPIDYR
jgi:hypothetical protein